jgi:hypothetical protein
MSEFQITRWHQIPSMVIARESEQVIKIMLPTRFQEAIDEAAMRMGEIDADAYISGCNAILGSNQVICHKHWPIESLENSKAPSQKRICKKF